MQEPCDIVYTNGILSNIFKLVCWKMAQDFQQYYQKYS